MPDTYVGAGHARRSVSLAGYQGESPRLVKLELDAEPHIDVARIAHFAAGSSAFPGLEQLSDLQRHRDIRVREVDRKSVV